MDLLLNLGIFAISIMVLLRASGWFVDSAELIGLSFRIPPYIIGVTIIAFGTSLPELATSIAAVLADDSEIVVGNVIGSNITNIALVLGLSALVAKTIELEYNVWEIDVPFLWGSAFLLAFVLLDLQVTVLEVAVLLAGIVLFLSYSFRGGSNEDATAPPTATWKHYGLFLLGGVLVWLSADFTIRAVTDISTLLGIPSKIIALSAVALGTSLPEVAVSINAARRGKAAIAIGNVIGSNIFNTFVVMGVPALLGRLIIPPDILTFYLPLMVAMTILLGMMTNNRQITRTEGGMLLLFYAVFMGEIVRAAL